MKRFLLPMLTLVLVLLFCVCALAETPDGFSFSGGSGKVTISCDSVTVGEDGQAYAEIVFSSPHYSYVKVDGETIYGTNTDTESAFTIPVNLNADTSVIGMTTAMSTPHEIEYTIHVELGSSETLPGLTYERSMQTRYATEFTVDYYSGGYKLITVSGDARYLIVPEGMDAPNGLSEDIRVIRQPLQNVYLAASSAMALFDAVDAVDVISLSGTDRDGWYIENAQAAMDAGTMVYAGKYSEPDYELLVKSDCPLAIESTMILHTPKVQEMLEMLGITVFIDRSSYETHPLGRTEWVKLYAAMLNKEDEAEAFFDEQAKVIDQLKDFENTEKTVAFFYISSDGSVVVRASNDYIAKMIELAGGRYIFSDLTDPDSNRSSVSITMEEFYAAAADADYLIYNAAIENPVDTLAELIAKDSLLADFKAVKEGNVWCTGKYLYQATDIVGNLITDINHMLTGTEEMTFLHKLS